MVWKARCNGVKSEMQGYGKRDAMVWKVGCKGIESGMQWLESGIQGYGKRDASYGTWDAKIC